jgi:hypothetical protein
LFIYYFNFLIYKGVIKISEHFSKIPKPLYVNPKIHLLYFPKDTPKKIFFAGRRPVSQPSLAEITCMTGRRESYRVILGWTREGGRRPPEKNFLGGILGFFQRFVKIRILFLNTPIFIKISEYFSKIPKSLYVIPKIHVCNSQNPFFVFSQDPPQKNFFCRPQAGVLTKPNKNTL